MVGRLSAAAELAGIDARFDLVRPTNTFDAHRLLRPAKHHGCQEAFASRRTTSYRGGAVSGPGKPGTARACPNSA
jgi:predicted DsbA family dithiol-disulfide isomerase